MYEDLANIQFFPIKDLEFSKWFQTVHYNGITLSREEREDFVNVINETVDRYSKGLPIMKDGLNHFKNINNEYAQLYCTIVSVTLFVLITMIDSMVASKYFLIADKDYDKRYMRGKLYVVLNEGFKKLYGFDEKTYPKSEWDKLLPLMHYFSEAINHQFQDLTFFLEKHAKSSSWWRDVRNNETHIKAEDLYKSRQEEIIESKVMIDSLKLFETLVAVSNYLSNLHTCFYNFMVNKYKRGELKNE